MKRYMKYLIQSAEIRTEQFLASQDKNPSSLQYGGIRGDIWEAKPTIYALATAVAVYLNRDSRFYQSERLYQGIELALAFVKRTQRDDGSFDYPSCNFKSAADTSFCFKRLFAAWRLLKKYESTGAPGIAHLEKEYLEIMHKALGAILRGGFHTPNHRWGITAALLQGANLFAEEKEFSDQLKKRAQQYLAEGIDGDDDGEYAERSTGNYNAVVNNAMMAMYEETKNEDFLGYVRRNLSMMLTYIDPDDTIFTQNSTRQDKGKKEYAGKYFYQYLFMASIEENPVFDGAAHKIIKDNVERGELTPDCLHIVMAHDEMMAHEFTHYGFLDTYRKFFRHSGVLRVKKANYAYTVIKGKSAFLFFQTGDTRVFVKIGESYCDIRNFIPSEIEPREDGCTLKGTAKGWYYLPFKEAPGTSDWWAMDQSKREKLINSTLEITLDIQELENGLEFSVKTEGLDRLPLRVETCIPAGAVLENEHFWFKAAAGESMILRDGYLTIRDEGNVLRLGPGFGEHEFQGHYSGEELNTDGYTVYCNAYTPAEKNLRLTIEE
ncbi:MAG TPA: hypothetical protein IAA51_14255 [Candidatus Cottocaccamicrobium excrementipullorum]|nr:hypothetical protein [Candidatus Cottocaccamicrobium excrementipullorum]